MRLREFYIISLFMFYPVFHTTAQTCCSGGTPLIGNLGVRGGEPKSWYFQIGYDYNFLNDLYSGTKHLNDNSRERLTQTVLLQTVYAFTDRFSVNGLFSAVEQKRSIYSPTGAKNVTSARGLGDAIILGQYSAIYNLKRSLILAAGPKLPVGKFNAVDPEFGIVLSPDLQPGSGSFDGIFALLYQESHLWNVPGLTLVTSAGYRITAPAKRFEGDDPYRFGNENLISTGLQKNFLIRRNSITPSLFLSYRNTTSDKISGSPLAGTGGSWLNFNPALSIEPGKSWSVNLSGEIPLYRNLNGTQLTTTYRFTVAVAYKIFNN